jgi:hypothetical protein
MLRRSTLVTVPGIDSPAASGLEGRPVPPQEMNRLFQEISQLAGRLPLQDPVRQEFLADIRKRFLDTLHSTQPEEIS